MRAIALNKTAVSLWTSKAALRALYGRSVLKYRFTHQERTSTIILVIINRIPIIPVAKRFGPQKTKMETARCKVPSSCALSFSIGNKRPSFPIAGMISEGDEERGPWDERGSTGVATR
jgi:hypothetical protein